MYICMLAHPILLYLWCRSFSQYFIILLSVQISASQNITYSRSFVREIFSCDILTWFAQNSENKIIHHPTVKCFYIGYKSSCQYLEWPIFSVFLLIVTFLQGSSFMLFVSLVQKMKMVLTMYIGFYSCVW